MTAFPVFSVLLVPVFVAVVVVTSRLGSLSVLFIAFENVESVIRLSTLTSSGVIDLVNGLFVQILVFQLFVLHVGQCRDSAFELAVVLQQLFLLAASSMASLKVTVVLCIVKVLRFSFSLVRKSDLVVTSVTIMRVVWCMFSFAVAATAAPSALRTAATGGGSDLYCS